MWLIPHIKTDKNGSFARNNLTFWCFTRKCFFFNFERPWELLILTVNFFWTNWSFWVTPMKFGAFFLSTTNYYFILANTDNNYIRDTELFIIFSTHQNLFGNTPYWLLSFDSGRLTENNEWQTSTTILPTALMPMYKYKTY